MIFYFSGTGNTRWIASQIAQAIGERLLSMADAMRDGQYFYTLAEGERIGFCFPTHGWQPPRLVRDFVRRLELRGADSDEAVSGLSPLNPDRHFCWALTTCGDDVGDAMTIFNKELRSRGLQAETLFSVIMPESYVCLPFMYTDTEERVSEKISNARRQLHHICETIRDYRRGVVELDKGPAPRLYSYVLGQYFNKRMITDRKFRVDADLCVRCGLCAKVCPVDNIETNTSQPPRWLHNDRCTCCLACYHHCPRHAINYGRITRTRGQYFCKCQ